MIKKSFIGIISGFITGLFATGGGMILVPLFVKLLKMSEKQARATSICCILPATILSYVFYAKDKLVDLKISIFCVIGGIIGALIGTKLLSKLSDNLLKICFSLFLLYTSIKFILN